MAEDETVKMAVKAVIPLHDSGLRKLMREYVAYKRVLIPRVRQAVRQVVKDKGIEVYAQQKWMVDKKLNEYLKNLPFHPMPFHRQSVYIERKDGGFWMHFKTKQGEAVCHLRVPDKYVPLIEKACGKDNPVLGQVELVEDKSREWVNCHITLRLPKPEPYEPNGWLGVDVGWNKLATSILATCNPHLTFSRPTFHGKDFKTRIIQLRRLLKEAQRKGRAVKMWGNRQRNTTKYAVGFVAKEIVSKAKSLKAGVAMERLTFKPVSKGYLVPRYRLMIAMKTLCEREGVPFKLVPAQYTSITCPKCGYVDDENRNGKRFTCRKCGYQADADIVGAMNVALKALNGTADGAVNDVRLASRLKPRKASPSEAGCVAQPKAAMRDVPQNELQTSAEKNREKREVKAKPQGGVEKKLEDWFKTGKEA
jgi:transposase